MKYISTIDLIKLCISNVRERVIMHLSRFAIFFVDELQEIACTKALYFSAISQRTKNCLSRIVNSFWLNNCLQFVHSRTTRACYRQDYYLMAVKCRTAQYTNTYTCQPVSVSVGRRLQ